jgi:hypothetical protein
MARIIMMTLRYLASNMETTMEIEKIISTKVSSRDASQQAIRTLMKKRKQS